MVSVGAPATTIDVARWYFDGREALASNGARLRQLIAAVNSPNELSSFQWAQWYAVALGFRPDLILELGRGRGNTTALFTEAASQIGGATRVVSLCQTADWMRFTAPALRASTPESWFERLDARVTDISSADYDRLFADRARVLVVWDAHGFDVAEVVFGEILPKIVRRDHLLLLHDILDNRYADVPRSYDGQPLWRGAAWQDRNPQWRTRVNLGWMHALQNQVVAIADFVARNGIELGSADHAFHEFFAADPSREAVLRDAIGSDFFCRNGHWTFLSLNGLAGPFHFPAIDGRHAAARGDVAANLPPVVETTAERWRIAATIPWCVLDAPAAGSRRWLHLRVRVSGGPVGIGLLADDGTTFTVRRAVAPSEDDAELWLPTEDAAGRLVVQTWDAPVAAAVRIVSIETRW